MRIFCFLVLLLPLSLLKAQTLMPIGIGYNQGGLFSRNLQPLDSSLSTKKWSFSRYTALSTSYVFFKGGSAAIISAPIGVQLNRRLNDNLYAFANITVAPTYINYNNPFVPAGFNKNATGFGYGGQKSFGIYPAASMGLMYVNDAKTFSISGSISVERGNNTLLPIYAPNNTRPAVYPAKR